MRTVSQQPRSPGSPPDAGPPHRIEQFPSAMPGAQVRRMARDTGADRARQALLVGASLSRGVKLWTGRTLRRILRPLKHRRIAAVRTDPGHRHGPILQPPQRRSQPSVPTMAAVILRNKSVLTGTPSLKSRPSVK